MRPDAAGFGAVLLLAGCAGLPTVNLNELDDRAAAVELDGVPFHSQQDFYCGPASLLTVLEASGTSPAFENVVARVYVPELKGSLQAEMAAAARGFGRIPFRLPGTLEAVLDQLEAGYPVLILQNLGLEAVPIWHYAVVVGFDRKRNRMVMRSGDKPRLETPAGRWLRQWHRAGRWGLVVLEPGQLPAGADRDLTLRALADFERQAEPDAQLVAWQAAVARWPDDPVAWLGAGNAGFRVGNHRDAEWAYQRALELEPGHLPARLNLAHTLEAEGRTCEAVELLAAAPPAADHPLKQRADELLGDLKRACRTSGESS